MICHSSRGPCRFACRFVCRRIPGFELSGRRRPIPGHCSGQPLVKTLAVHIRIAGSPTPHLQATYSIVMIVVAHREAQCTSASPPTNVLVQRVEASDLISQRCTCLFGQCEREFLLPRKKLLVCWWRHRWLRRRWRWIRPRRRRWPWRWNRRHWRWIRRRRRRRICII